MNLPLANSVWKNSRRLFQRDPAWGVNFFEKKFNQKTSIDAGGPDLAYGCGCCDLSFLR